ncbi:MAG: hypothetical protein D3909_07415 [Candidatus Electrothrix sp. ATG1]|nr:hypothetical protein [Candidatus Electrothrix sp. ATG1]
MMIYFFTFLVKIVRWVIAVSSVATCAPVFLLSGTNYATEVDKKCQRDNEEQSIQVCILK